jgi:hypothetical protein
LPGNNNAATKGDTVATEYATCVDQTKNELNMCTSTAAHHCAQGGMAAREIGATAIRAFAGRAATGLILGDTANKFDGVTKKNDEYEKGTKNDGTASAPFGKQPRSMTHAEKQDGDFHGSMFNDLYDTTNWRLLGEKNTKDDVIAATLLSALPGNYAATKGDTVAAEYATSVDQTKNELNVCTSTAIRAFAVRAATGLILGNAANKFDGVTKKNDEYETGTKHDGTASAPFGKQPRRYGLPVVVLLVRQCVEI